MSQLANLQKEKDNLTSKIENINDDIATVNANIERLAKDILLNAIITGTEFTIRHGSIAPYTTGYMIESPHVEKSFCYRVTCQSEWYKNIVNNLYDYLDWSADKYEELAKKVDAAWKAMPTSYNKDAYGPDNSLHGHHIANGYETDGFKNIVTGRCGGTWSSYTTCSQNDLARELCILRGFGADFFVEHESQFTMPKELVEHIYRENGLLGEDSVLDDEWFANNPNRCVLN